jgi:prepilin-type N-terminal cleavage/methylation domain-containing protein
MCDIQRATHGRRAPPRPRGRGGDGDRSGFTLAEVMVALLILSVGFLALIPLGASGTRLVAAADRRTQRTVQAMTELERAALRLRFEGELADSAWTLPNGDTFVRTVTYQSGQELWTVTVQVAPPPPAPGTQAVTLRSHVFIP